MISKYSTFIKGTVKGDKASADLLIQTMKKNQKPFWNNEYEEKCVKNKLLRFSSLIKKKNIYLFFFTQAEDLCSNFSFLRALSTSSGGKDDNWKKFEVSKKLPKRAIADKKTFKGKVVPYINYLQSYQRIGIVFINTTNLSIKIMNMNEWNYAIK